MRLRTLTFALSLLAVPMLAQTPPPGPPATAKDPQHNEMVGREAVPTIDMGAPAKRTPQPKQPTPAVHAVGGVGAPDGSSVDSILAAMYQSVSHGPDGEPNWKRMHEIFLPVGVLIPPKRPDAQEFSVLDVDAFQERVLKGMAAAKQRGDSTAFFESEIARTSECFGRVCQIFSTYEGKHAPGDAKPFVRGINSVQLVNDGTRWWISSVIWDTEKPDQPIPAQYEKK